VITLTNTDISGIENTLNEIDSHNSLATERIIDTIKQESIEVSSDIIRKSKDLEASNVKTRNLVRQKTEKIDKNVSRLSDRQELIDKLIEEQAEEIEEELERIYEQESDMIENELNSQFEKEANDIESNLS
jgi:endonuclease III